MLQVVPSDVRVPGELQLQVRQGDRVSEVQTKRASVSSPYFGILLLVLGGAKHAGCLLAWLRLNCRSLIFWWCGCLGFKPRGRRCIWGWLGCSVLMVRTLKCLMRKCDCKLVFFSLPFGNGTVLNWLLLFWLTCLSEHCLSLHVNRVSSLLLGGKHDLQCEGIH